ncbi:hypothetical protein ACQEVX_19705 [Streptomyces syringium]|uniref:hypothetical protein n=1 Tax=Streptomyces syringium TaxID=76729 RepID=UPI003D8C8BF9
MPRGRHRHSPPLHRLLPSSTVAATSVACAAGAWVVGETVLIRSLAAAAAAASVVGAVLMRRWDRSAGKRVAQLTAARVRDEWKTEERIAELETDLEESRLLRTRLETKLRAKRSELARLRTEHADLLRRYATAETERAGVLERQRLLTKNSAAPAAKELEAAASARQNAAAAYVKAADALRNLERNGAAQRAAAETPDVPAAAVPAPKALEKAERPANAADPKAVKAPQPPRKPGGPGKPGPGTPGLMPAPRPGTGGVVRDQRTVPAAAAVVPQAPARTASRAQGGFDFFGTQATPALPARTVEEEDLADVVGEEALAERERAQAAEAAAVPDLDTDMDDTDTDTDIEDTDEAEAEGGTEDDDVEPRTAADGSVIDLTAHDETEQIDVAGLRSAI